MTSLLRKSYRPYVGSRTRSANPALTIASLELRLAFRNAWVRRLLIGAIIPVLFCTAFLYFNVVIEGRIRTRIFDLRIYTSLYRAEIVFLMLAMAAAGSGSIARDVASRAHQLYFSRPVSPWQYCLGKVGALFVLFGLGFLVPGLALAVIDLVLSPNPDFADLGKKLAAIGVYGLLVSASAAGLIAFISSLGRRPRNIGMAWVGAWVFSSVVAGLLGRRDLDHPAQLLSIQNLFLQAGYVLYAPEEEHRGATAALIVGLAGLLGFALLVWRVRGMQRREEA